MKRNYDMKKKLTRILACAAAVPMSVVLLAGCGLKKAEESVEESNVQESAEEFVAEESEVDAEETGINAEETAEAEEQAYREALLTRYKNILDNIGEYQFIEGVGSENAVYQYAIVQMQPGAAPTLLVSQGFAGDYVYQVRVFQYDRETGVVYKPENYILQIGAAAVGGFRGGISVEGDGNGLAYATWSSGTGETKLKRVTLVGDKLTLEDEWSGIMDQMPERSDKEIVWFDIIEKDKLEEILFGDGTVQPDAATNSDGQEQVDGAQAAADAISSEETQPGDTMPEVSIDDIEDGGRMVLQGTIRVMSYDELLQYQGMPDPSPGYRPDGSYVLLILDEPQDIVCMNGDGDGSRLDTANMIAVPVTEETLSYNGIHVIASFDSSKTWWPSDVSLPIGEPASEDIHILG